MPPRHACDACYRRKIQCSIPNPGSPCNWCDHHGLECTFDKERPRKSRRNRVTENYLQGLVERIRQLEAAQGQSPTDSHTTTVTAQQASPASQGPVVSPHDGVEVLSPSLPLVSSQSRNEAALFTQAASATPFESPQYPGPATTEAADVFPIKHSLGLNWFFNGTPIFSEQGQQWLLKKTGQAVEWAKYRVLAPGPSLNPPLTPAEICQLPNRTAVEEILALYFQSSFRLSFPVIDRESFDETLQTAYDAADNPLTSPPHLSATACVLSALCVLSRLRGPENRFVGINASVLSARARFLFLCLAGDTTLVSLQTALLLHIHYAWRGQWQDAELFLSISCRTISVLGGHVYRPLNDRHLGHTRALFWLCYLFDKDFSLRTGRVPLLSGAYCDLTLPEGYEDGYAYLRNLNEFWGVDEIAYNQLVPHFPGDLRLGELKEKVYRTLYSAHAFKTIDGLLVYIRQLDDEIESWRLSVPADFRPVLSLAPTTPLFPSEMKTPHRMRFAHLQFEYHHLITVVHTTVRRYSSASDSVRTEEEAEAIHTVIHSSIDLTLEASRSTLSCLREVVLHLPQQAFRFIVFYPCTAAMALFLNMVIHPRDEEVQPDVERLVSAANVIRSLPTEGLVVEEIQRLKDTSDFIMGLVWLGTCAIMKSNADGEGRHSHSYKAA